jgi:predicted ATPase
MPSLREIRVQRFKTIEDAPFDLGPINLLVGANNSGKSTIIQALHFGVGVLQTINLLGLWPSKNSGSHIMTLNPSHLEAV